MHAFVYIGIVIISCCLKLSYNSAQQTQTLASAEVNARRRCSVVTKHGSFHPACGALPEPGRIVDDLDLFAGKQLVAGGLSHRVIVPDLEVNEHKF